jgi:hypothetical protein
MGASLSRAARSPRGLAPGSAPDIFARLIGQWLSDRLGQQFVIENQSGVGTNIATESVVRATPDGYMLLLISAPNAINATLYEKLNFDFIRDIAPICSFVDSPEVLVVHPSVPVHSGQELIAYAKANSGILSMASPGIGSGPHMSGELFKWMAAIDLTNVPYRGGGPDRCRLVSRRQRWHSRISEQEKFEHSVLLTRSAHRCCQKYPQLPNSCQDMSQEDSLVSGRQRRLRRRLSAGSIPQSTRRLPIRASEPGLPRWAFRHWADRLSSSPSSSPTRATNGPR